MRVKCIMCSKEFDISKLHKDYKKLISNPKATYVCDSCSRLVSRQASHGKVLEKK